MLSRGSVLFSKPGLRERLSALPLGALKEERSRAGIWRVIGPSFNDLGGLLPSAETLKRRRPPWVATLCIVRNWLYILRLPWGQCKEWHVPLGYWALSSLKAGVSSAPVPGNCLYSADS